MECLDVATRDHFGDGEIDTPNAIGPFLLDIKLRGMFVFRRRFSGFLHGEFKRSCLLLATDTMDKMTEFKSSFFRRSAMI